MSINNLEQISNFTTKNKTYSDFNLINNFLYNLNFTNINYKKKLHNQLGGTHIDPYNVNQIDLNNNFNQIDPNNINQIDHNFNHLDLNNINQIDPNFNHLDLNNLNENIPIPDYTSDVIKTYTIKEGTILYHSTSNKKGFNTNYIKLGKDNIISFFTPNFKLASDNIEGCNINRQNGYIHVFKVIKDIPNIYIMLPFDIDNESDFNIDTLNDKFCKSDNLYYGVGFFYPKNEIEKFSNIINPLNNYNQESYSEFGLCNPTPYLEYLYTQKCMSLRKLSEPYKFN